MCSDVRKSSVRDALRKNSSEPSTPRLILSPCLYNNLLCEMTPVEVDSTEQKHHGKKRLGSSLKEGKETDHRHKRNVERARIVNSFELEEESKSIFEIRAEIEEEKLKISQSDSSLNKQYEVRKPLMSRYRSSVTVDKKCND